MNPAEALAIAPVVRFARFDNLGRADEYVGAPPFSNTPIERSRFERATFCRSAFRLVK